MTQIYEIIIITITLKKFPKDFFSILLGMLSHQKKLRKLITFQACKLFSVKMTKTILLNCQVAFLGVTVIYHSKIEAWERRQSCNTLVSLR